MNAMKSTRYNTSQHTTTMKLMAYDSRLVVAYCGLSSLVASECAKFAPYYGCQMVPKTLHRSIVHTDDDSYLIADAFDLRNGYLSENRWSKQSNLLRAIT